MAANEAKARCVEITVAAPAAANGGLGPISGDPLIMGLAHSPSAALACVAETSYTPPGGLTPTGNITVKLEGSFFLTVSAKSSINPGNGVAINPGDRIYADGGTIDATTGMLYGFTLNANSSTGWYFGNALTALASGQTGTVEVRLKVGG